MNTLEARRRLLGRNVYKRTTEGNPAIAQGSLARRYPGITMQGWTEQAQYEGKNLFDFSSCSHGLLDWSSGIIETVRYNQYYHSDYVWLSAGTYYIKVNGTGTTLYSYIWCDNDKQYVGGKFWGQVPNIAFTIESDCYVRFAFASSPLADMTETYLEYAEKANIMLNAGSTALPYEPYTGGQPSPSPDYPQEIVNAGKYNEDTQKWEFEITIANEQTDPDKNQTVTLTSDRPLTQWDKLEKRNGQWGWVYKSAEIVLDGSEDEAWYLEHTDNYDQFYINIATVDHLSSENRAYCEKFRSAILGDRETEKEIIYTVRGITGAIAVSTELATEVDAWKTWLQSNPITVLYKSTEETFVPLSSSEQEQMNELYTFRPTTVLSNDCGCNMTLTYKTKKSLQPVSGGYKEA